jgi:hypothetical protein
MNADALKLKLVLNLSVSVARVLLNASSRFTTLTPFLNATNETLIKPANLLCFVMPLQTNSAWLAMGFSKQTLHVIAARERQESVAPRWADSEQT